MNRELFAASPMHISFLWLLHYYREFDFEARYIGAWLEPDPVAPRAASALPGPLWLCSPLDPNRNLGER
eukprot:268498-Alexandrium_andersonii.AAC.1